MNINFNYAKVYDIKGELLKEGYVDRWEMGMHSTMIMLVFDDGFAVRVSVNHVFMFHK